ncbi:3-hydroxyacyl-CoA dehydrogenase family protein [Flavihumibacter rivuli]|uniref:3-hydroxyacyl-CoA dehydrogenase family protein n=1 Tax=Flavihumibacter rivuli TaxID=2838156 RepID=UPI001BDEC5C1|nr:3-hydroxyacyl-CoA dehydrogenase family protein [Flavihumibacter rivuli]ULQ56182.1 3-hydroxyacyl-CoA dehydrogenase family protein [Flavihumibacter rivuli]
MQPMPIYVAILGDPSKGLFSRTYPETIHVEFYDDWDSWLQSGAGLFIDTRFEYSPQRIEALEGLLPATVMVNCVEYTCSELHGFVRYNGWTGFEQTGLLECCTDEDQLPAVVKEFADLAGLKLMEVPDQPGLVRARIVCSIINEAYHALGEGVSSAGDIDIAMKLGTNYPFGPFEWAGLIGHGRVISLLHQLTAIHERYQPAPSLLTQSHS